MSDPVESESVPVVTPEAPSEPGSATAPEAALMNVPPVPEATNMADDEVKVTSEIESGSKSGETEAQPAVVEAPTPVVDAEPLPEKLESVLSNSSTGSRTKSKDRGGELACSTCHVVLDKELYDKLPAKLEEEDDMLDLAMGLTPTSRLSCQLEVTDLFEGAEVVIPEDE